MFKVFSQKDLDRLINGLAGFPSASSTSRPPNNINTPAEDGDRTLDSIQVTGGFGNRIRYGDNDGDCADTDLACKGGFGNGITDDTDLDPGPSIELEDDVVIDFPRWSLSGFGNRRAHPALLCAPTSSWEARAGSGGFGNG